MVRHVRPEDEKKKRPFGLEWDVEDMVRHQKNMLEIIMNNLNSAA